MKILFVLTNSALSRGMNTGLENLAWGLAENGVQVHILAGGNKPHSSTQAFSIPATVNYYFTGQSGDNPTNLLSHFENIVREHQIDVVVGWIINTALLTQSRSAKGVRFIANLGQMPPRSMALRFLKQSLLGKMKFGEAFKLVAAIKKYPAIADMVVSISQSVQKASIPKYGLKSERCMVIPRGIDTDIYDFHLRQTEIGVPVEVLFAGNVQDGKGVGDIARALCLVKNPVLFRLCGPAPEGYIELLKIVLKDTDHQVMHMGAVGQQELTKYYHQCDIFAFPSHSEGLGKALIEAMSCGCPVVCSDIPTFKELVQNEQNGLMVPRSSPRHLAEAIDLLIADGALREKCSENARKTVQMNFSKKIEIDSWLRILQDYSR